MKFDWNKVLKLSLSLNLKKNFNSLNKSKGLLQYVFNAKGRTMIKFNYRHTQQKRRLERLFKAELSALILKNQTKLVTVEFQLYIDDKGNTKQEVKANVITAKTNMFFNSRKARFKKSTQDVILDIKNYLAHPMINQHI